MKFSGIHQDGRYRIGSSDGNDYWIVKTPSTVHSHVPKNEYTSMRLAEAAGVDIPEIRLVPLSSIDNLQDIRLPDEKYASAIRRFDRQQNKRLHSEDFAQIFALYPHNKYGSANYEQIGRTIYQFCQNGLADLQQMARRLLVNILLANGDAHIKNWSVVYPDRIYPKLVPAYDIVSTLPYNLDETEIALNLARQKNCIHSLWSTLRNGASVLALPGLPYGCICLMLWQKRVISGRTCLISCLSKRSIRSFCNHTGKNCTRILG